MTEPSPGRKAPKILCAGIAVQDIVMRVQNFPPPGAKVHASEFIITGGGCAANAAVSIVRLGGRVAFAGPLGGGGDGVSNRIVADLEAEGINCSGAVRVDGGTASVSLILLDAEGEKTIATRRGVNLGKVLPADAAKLVADADAVLIDNRFPEFVTAVCRAAQARKIPVVIDLDLATKPDDPLLSLGTHVVASTEALRATTGEADYGAGLNRLAKQLKSFLAVTDGPQGVYWLEQGALKHMPAFKVTAIDSLGAGDAFHGAFTLALAEGRALPDILRFASATAALKCTKFGGASAAPERAAVEQFLKEN
ncbi:MAG TPA: PfkB family carbohydrate kinase [Pseudolabrys sp.]|nr:PfkB family carbohydrate kinase [Pseudolabrys sp.]